MLPVRASGVKPAGKAGEGHRSPQPTKANPMAYHPTPRRSGYPSVTATARVAENLALYGHTPHDDEPEYRHIPEDDVLDGIVSAIFDAITGPLTDSALDPDLNDFLWSVVNAFHHKTERVQRILDDNAREQVALIPLQDGSEIESVKLERLTEPAHAIRNRRDAFERMRDAAENAFAEATGSVWRPRAGSVVNHKKQTAAVIDSQDYLNAKRYAETNVLIPPGTKIAITGGTAFTDYKAVYAALDDAFRRHPDMVLLHCGTRTGVDHIAVTWCKNRGVKAIGFQPAWKPGDRSAPFKRNDILLAVMPKEVIVFPGNGISDNLADKAAKLGIPLDDRRPRA